MVSTSQLTLLQPQRPWGPMRKDPWGPGWEAVRAWLLATFESRCKIKITHPFFLIS